MKLDLWKPREKRRSLCWTECLDGLYDAMVAPYDHRFRHTIAHPHGSLDRRVLTGDVGVHVPLDLLAFAVL